ncbi:MAG TPA: hypothetical protein VKB57_12585 [Acidimicrobiales bacterium]|nr:hypothetical protein [Acidimicrobiales bacterium]
MIARPTTEQIARDCARELLDTVLPAVQGEAAAVGVRMLDNVLRNIAVRAAHEIAWMTEETAAMEAYARDLLTAMPQAAGVEEALAAVDGAPRAGLHLDDVVETYTRAGEAFALAMEAAVEEGDVALTRRARELLDLRSGHEVEAMADWSPIGR